MKALKIMNNLSFGVMFKIFVFGLSAIWGFNEILKVYKM